MLIPDEDSLGTLEEELLAEEVQSGARIVPQSEVMRSQGGERARWYDAAHEELLNFKHRGVFAPPTRAERELAYPLPMKCVWALKKDGRRRCRAVVCGNFQSKNTQELVYTAQVDISTLLAVLRLAAWSGWQVCTVDISAAFLYADLPQDSPPVLVWAPKAWKDLGLEVECDVWVLSKALYGLRAAPRAWSIHRDAKLKELVFQSSDNECWLEQNPVDKCLWHIRGVNNKFSGFMVTHVDDLLIISRSKPSPRIFQLFSADLNLFVKVMDLSLHINENSLIRSSRKQVRR